MPPSTAPLPSPLPGASTYAAIGFTHHLMGSPPEAIEYYHRALALKSNDTFSLQMLDKVRPPPSGPSRVGCFRVWSGKTLPVVGVYPHRRLSYRPSHRPLSLVGSPKGTALERLASASLSIIQPCP